MFCRKCGKEIKDESIFCSYCGATVQDESEQSADVQKEENQKEQEVETDPGQKPVKKKIWPWVIVILVILWLIGSCGSSSDDSSGSEYDESSEDESDEQSQSQYVQVTLEELYRKSDVYEGQKIIVDGTVWNIFGTTNIYNGLMENITTVEFEGSAVDKDGNVVGNVLDGDKVYVVGIWEGLDIVGQGTIDADGIIVLE